MLNYLFVHGGNVSTNTWNQLTEKNDYPPGQQLGGKVWNSIIPLLHQQGHKTFTLTLKDEHDYSLSDHIDQVCQLIMDNKLEKVILVGHSYGGMVITGAASHLADKIALLVYIDAALPEPGQSLVEILNAAKYDPARVLGGSPKAYREKLQFDPDNLRSLAKAYILCTKSEFSAVTDIAKQKIINSKENWLYKELASSHIPMATMPNELAQLLVDFGKQLEN
jgi:pimeloyl-ACP methyl ester carboxylesterase